MGKILYIAGPYRGKTENETFHNIMNAHRRMEWAWANGWIPLCPHCNSMFTEGVAPTKVILAGYRKLVELCDAILMIDGWGSSEGAMAERDVALAQGLQIVPDPYGEYIRRIGE